MLWFNHDVGSDFRFDRGIVVFMLLDAGGMGDLRIHVLVSGILVLRFLLVMLLVLLVIVVLLVIGPERTPRECESECTDDERD